MGTVRTRNQAAKPQVEGQEGVIQADAPPEVPMARVYYGQFITQIVFLLPRIRKVIHDQSGLMTDKPGHYTIKVRENYTASPEVMKSMDPSGRGVIYDPDDGRLNIKGNPFLYQIDLNNIGVEGNASDSEMDEYYDDDLMKAYFIHVYARPKKDNTNLKDPKTGQPLYKYQRIQKLIDSSGKRDFFFMTEAPAVLFKEFPIPEDGQIPLLAYDPSKFKVPVLKSGKFLETTGQVVSN